MSFHTNRANKRQPATSTFVIDNFSSCSFIVSPAFNLPCDDIASFQLCMNTKLDMISTAYWKSKYISFSLYLNSSLNQGRITVKYRMSIVNAKGQKCHTQEGRIKFSKQQEFGGQYILSRNDLFDTANGWLVNDKLAVYCEVYLVDSDLDENTALDESIKPSVILQDYGSLFESGRLSDVVLVAGGIEFKAHKAILSARSVVFGAMFEHDTKEKESNRIEVENVSGETYHELLRYIYTDRVDKMEENALELMVAADKYQLEHLKSICEQYLCANLSTESVAITLANADLYRAEGLKTKCFEYIARNIRNVKATEGWKNLFSKPELITEVLLYVSDNYVCK